MGNQTFHNIILMGRPGVKGVPETLSALKQHLDSLNTHLYIDKNTAPLLPDHNLPIIDKSSIPNECDCVIVVGGDGSLLNAAHLALAPGLPVLGINRGRLGFLTDIHPDELHKVEAVIKGEHVLEKRFVLKATLTHNGKTLHDDIALNDVVLLPSERVQMIEFDQHVNDQFVCRQRADGLIIATPTGSTAYALSGGGPILQPGIDAVVMVPMFPHTLSSRPVVVGGDSHIDIVIGDNIEAPAFISCDGANRVAAPAGAKLHIQKNTQALTLIHPTDYNYFTTLREKLNWEKHAVHS